MALDLNYQSGYGITAVKLTGLYLWEFDDMQIGVGGGMIDVSSEGPAKFIELALNYSLDAISIYGAVDVYLDGPDDTVFKLGAGYTF